MDPSVYEQQQQADAAGVRSVAGFIVELSDRWTAISHSRGCCHSLLAVHVSSVLTVSCQCS